MRRHKLSYPLLTIIWGVVSIILVLPHPVICGNLKPSVQQGSSLKTLEGIFPTWSQILPPSERFQMVMGDSAVLDMETGLVWERSPDNQSRVNWTEANRICYQLEVANRKGWRLPTIEELASLVDNDNSSPALPANHPFNNVQSSSNDFYWSATTFVEDTSEAYKLYLRNGKVIYDAKAKKNYKWCVRGGYGHDY